MSLSPQEYNEMVAGFSAPLVLQLRGGEVSSRRLALLAAIASAGSISGAARQVGMTYKAAWDAIEAMNNLAGQPLVMSQQGGTGGGGARLTDVGQRVVDAQRRVEEALSAVLGKFQGEGDWLEDLSMLGSLNMKTSARNALRGKIVEVRHGAVNSEVTVRLQGDDYLNVIITKDSAEELGLVPDKPAWALVKASWIILVPADECMKVSARNRLCGVVKRVQEGAVNAEVIVELSGGNTLTAIVTEGSLDELHLQEGSRVCALIKSTHIILGVDD